MIRHGDRLEISTHDFLSVCRERAKNAELGGVSRVRSDRSSRKSFLGEDQIVGQLGEAALSIFVYGNLDEYHRNRDKRDANPNAGDNGWDLLELPIDVKTSLMRSAHMEATDYRLCVRPREKHVGHIYVLALVPQDLSTVYLVGWLPEDELPIEVDGGGTFEGAHVVRAKVLKPMHRLEDFVVDLWKSCNGRFV